MTDPVTGSKQGYQTGTFGAPDYTYTRRMQRGGGSISMGASGGGNLVKKSPRTKSGNRKYK